MWSRAGDYPFDGRMSEEVLRNYLSRSMTTMYLLTSHGDFEDNLRMLTNCGVKFAGRAVYQWGREEGGESALPGKLERARKNAARIHGADPDLILQACIFEIVSRDVENLPVPAWAFEGLGRPVERRHFRYEDMLYSSGRSVNQWGRDASVPDVSRPETQLWFYYLAASYLDAGCEAIHFGQAELMNGNDPNLDHWSAVLKRTRDYAARKARRHFVLCDAHVPRGGLVRDGHLLFDFHSFPLRIEELPEAPRKARLRVGFTDAIYGRSRGGIAPSGWECEHLPYLVEFDNYGRSRKPGEPGMGPFWVWGWDEITWFSQQPEPDRNDWLRYAWHWVREHDTAGYLQMPGFRCLSGALDGNRWYDVNRPSAATPNGFGQEQTIRELWLQDTGRTHPAAPPSSGGSQ
ncbi:MAG: hypothetical protein KIT22_08375 [Verrucomicrobiae bacterium]|nr:hypothetical protein [Verrucomicrobiae bacterium]